MQIPKILKIHGRTKRLETDNQSGFTLVDTVVSIFIFSILAYGVIILISNLFTNFNKQSAVLNDTDQARKVVSAFTNQIRGAATGADGSFSLNSAGDQQIIFFSNGGGATVNRYRYFLNNGTLSVGVTAPTNNVYNPANEIVTVVQNDLANGAAPIFYYYNGSFDGSETPLTQPINVTQVRFVKISLIVTNKAGVTNTNTFTVSGGAAIRNLKDNLGN